MTISGGNPSIFLSSTVCVVLAVMIAGSLLFPLWQGYQLRRKARLVQDRSPAA